MSQRAAVSREVLHREGFYPEESNGLFVGISRFEDPGFAKVRFAVDDAVDLAWVFSLELGLVDPARCVLALAGEPQKAVSRDRMTALLSSGARQELPSLIKLYRLAGELSRAGGERGLFVLSAATHGHSEPGRGDYLLAADTVHENLEQTALPLQVLIDKASLATPRRRLLLLDACREWLNQKRGAAEAGMSESFAAAIAAAQGLTALLGSTSRGYAYDDLEQQNGVFSGALVEGLLGAAPVDERGFITTATLAKFVQSRVQAWVRRHRPKHVDLSRGIEATFDEAGARLPLAIDPKRTLALADYQRRRLSALTRLREQIGKGLSGSKFDELAAYLPDRVLPSPEHEKLLVRIEELEGSESALHALLYLFGELRGPASNRPIKVQLRPRILALNEPLPRGKAKSRSEPQPGELYVDPLGLRFRFVPGGTYLVGSPETDLERDADEGQHEETVEDFWLAETPMTQAFWVGQGLKNPSRFQENLRCPVESVSWYDAAAIANRVSEKVGLSPCYELVSSGVLGEKSFKCSAVRHLSGTGYRLPTEWEWEVAARAQLFGGEYQARHGGIHAIAWYAGNSGRRTHPVGEKAANVWGLHDMLGNVGEWTESSSGLSRVYRGGSWNDRAGYVRATHRNGCDPGFRFAFLGFRFLLSRPRAGQEKGSGGR